MTNPINPEAAEALEQLKSDIRQAMIEYGSAFKKDHKEGIRETSTRCCALLDRLAALASTPPPAVSAEPVAWRYQDGNGRFRYRGYVPGFDVEYALLKPIALYAHPAPQPQPSKAEPPAAQALRIFDEAIAAELPRVSHVEYDSHEICKHFAGEVRKRISALAAAETWQAEKADESLERIAVLKTWLEPRLKDNEERFVLAAIAAHGSWALRLLSAHLVSGSGTAQSQEEQGKV